MDRKSFITFSASAAGLALLSPQRLLAGSSTTDPFTLVSSVERKRVLRIADHWLKQAPQSVTSTTSPMNPGTIHDYFSQADYFWPDPNNPDGPYISRDGVSNPSNFHGHRKVMYQFGFVMPALAAAYLFTQKKEYGQAAAAHLKAWFIDPETKMNPNLEYAQGIHNGPHGNSFGVIDTLHLVEPARAATFVREFLSDTEWTTIQTWYRDYLTWMKTSENGKKEQLAPQNHSMAWALQAAEFARLIGDETTRTEVHDHFVNVQLPDQMAMDGSFPRELARTKPYAYSVLNFDLATTLCWSLGREEMERFTLPDGRGMCKAASFLEPYLADKERWPYQHDVQQWEYWPARSVGLLFTGIACSKPDYIEIWRRLNPEPTGDQMLRIKQPILWIAK